MNIIGVTGYSKSGKTAFVESLGATDRPFAGPLKKVLAEVYGLSYEQLYGNQKEVVDERWGMTPRQIMQRFGTEVGRSVHPDTWVRAWERAVAAWSRSAIPALAGVRALCVSDVRFPNEADAIRRLGGKIVRVIRPESPEGAAAPPAQLAEHASERPDEIVPDLVVVNDGTLDDLHLRARWAHDLFFPPTMSGPTGLLWRRTDKGDLAELTGRLTEAVLTGDTRVAERVMEATVGDFVGGDGVRFTLDHRPTCYRRGPWHLMIEVAPGENHHAWGCFDEQDQPSRWYHDRFTAQEEARRIAAVLVRDRWAR